MNLSKSLLAYLMVKQATRVFSKEKKQTAANAMEEFGTFAPPTSGVGIHANLIPGAPIAAPAASTLVNRPENNGALRNLPLVAGATASVAPGTPTVVATPKPTAASAPPAAKPTAASAPPTAASAQAPITRTIGRVPTAQPASAPIASEPTQTGQMPNQASAAPLTQAQSLAAARAAYLRNPKDDSALKAHFKQFPSEAQQLIQGAGDVYKEVGGQVDAFGKGHNARAQAYDHRNEWINRDSGGSSILQGDSSRRYSRTHPENMSVIDGGKGHHIQPLNSRLFGKAENMMAKADQIRGMQMRELHGTPAVATAPTAAPKPAAAPAPSDALSSIRNLPATKGQGASLRNLPVIKRPGDVNRSSIVQFGAASTPAAKPTAAPASSPTSWENVGLAGLRSPGGPAYDPHSTAL